MNKRFYIVFVAREQDGGLHKVPIPMQYACIFVAAAALGAFTITGIAGSYTRMLLETARFNQVRTQRAALRKDYQRLRNVAHEKEVQAASLGSLASEIEALYGLRHPHAAEADGLSATALPADNTGTDFTQDAYVQSLNELNSLRSIALAGNIADPLEMSILENRDGGNWGNFASAPSLWPIMGRVSSPFGERVNPFSGLGTEFHPGIDIAADVGTPVHTTANGTVIELGDESGYGRFVKVNNGHGIVTVFAHLSGVAVAAGERVRIGEVLGYVGNTGRSTGPHLLYEVRINGTPVNPHPFMHTTEPAPAGGESPSLYGSEGE